MKHVISCSSSGIQAVQNDVIPLHSLGKSQMTRASDVVWDNELQLWVATIRPEFRRENSNYEWVSESRERAIQWEINYLNNNERKLLS